ncbi:hypothetical protein [Psychromonas aquimarina]|uniref:hypothetical protein n=1 Tax=Psychromonas aquimarina TaxID=444919 RepID=UPI00041F0128|nr:hypothetical protein [Psychromonas aquimarina]
MIFHNKAGQAMNLADNLTIKELLEMGVEITISEKVDPMHELWLADELKEDPVEAKHGKHVH